MKKLVVITIIILLLPSCATQVGLYSWANYDKVAYNYLKNSNEESINELFKGYQEMIHNQKGTRGTVPPGIFADYAFLLLEQGDREQAIDMLNQETSLYPESKIFIERILKMIEK